MSFSSEVKEELSRHLPDGTPLPDCGNSGDPVTLRTDFREGRDDTDSDRECVCGKKVLYFVEKTFNIEASLQLS